MTHPTDYLSHPQSEGGQRLHTQESGDAGLSSNMNHRISVDYDDGPFPVADYSSFVKPISKDEFQVFEPPVFTRKIWSFSSAAVQAEESQGRFLKSSAAKQNYPPAATEDDLEEETVKGLPTAVTITEEHSDAEGEESTIMEANMDAHKNVEMPNLRPHVLPGGRKRNVSRKRAPVKNRTLMAVFLVVSFHAATTGGGSAAPFRSPLCFKCMDDNKCPNLKSIFSTDDTPLYHRGLNRTLPGCSDMCSPTEGCNVCSAQRNILIVCSEGVSEPEVEDSDGNEISHISPARWDECKDKFKMHDNCSKRAENVKDKHGTNEEQETSGRARHCLIAALLLTGGVVLCLCGLLWKKKD